MWSLANQSSLSPDPWEEGVWDNLNSEHVAAAFSLISYWSMRLRPFETWLKKKYVMFVMFEYVIEFSK